jgi:hypothetical protein
VTPGKHEWAIAGWAEARIGTFEILTELRNTKETAMKRFMFSATLATAAIALVLCAAAANAAEERPFKSTVEVTFQGFDDDLRLFSGTGRATHLGRVAVSTVVDLDFDDWTAIGIATLASSHVDSITIEFYQAWDQAPGVDPARGTYVGTYWITGGTGKFEGARGTGTFVNRPGDGTRIGEYDGTISY